MNTIFKKLQEDHDIQRSLLDKLIETSGASDERTKLWKRLKEQLEAHAKYEERVFYKPLFESDHTQEMARHSVAEHKDINDIIEKLDDTEMSSPAWLVYAKKLDHLVKHHLKEEENEVFPLAGQVLDRQEKTSQARRYEMKMEEQVTH